MFGQEKKSDKTLKTTMVPKKVQLATELKLVKPKFDQVSQETITKYTTTDCPPVYFFGISSDDFYGLIENLTVALCTFASHVRGGFCWK